MIRKLISIVVAIAINVAVLAWFHAWSASVVASASVAPAQPLPAVTLPVINVHPSAAQLHALQRGHTSGTLPAASAKRA